MKKILQYAFNILLFVVGVFLIFHYRRPASMKNLGMMMLGLVSLFILLHSYNKKYK